MVTISLNLEEDDVILFTTVAKNHGLSLPDFIKNTVADYIHAESKLAAISGVDIDVKDKSGSHLVLDEKLFTEKDDQDKFGPIPDYLKEAVEEAKVMFEID